MPPAEADLEDGDVNSGGSEDGKSERGQDLKMRGRAFRTFLRFFQGGCKLFESRGKTLFRNFLPVNPYPLATGTQRDQRLARLIVYRIDPSVRMQECRDAILAGFIGQYCKEKGR